MPKIILQGFTKPTIIRIFGYAQKYHLATLSSSQKRKRSTKVYVNSFIFSTTPLDAMTLCVDYVIIHYHIDYVRKPFSFHHRNLRSKTSMLAQVLQIVLGKEHLVKNRLISILDKVIYFKEQCFSGLQNLSSLHKIGWRSAEKKFYLFSNMLLQA
jgi:hypothetical protein